MSVNCVPESVTKDVLFKKAQERFAYWAKLYGDPAVSAQYLYEDMSSSVFSGSPADDFPDEFKSEPDKPVRVSDREFKYRDIVFCISHDADDDKSYIWCDKYNDTDDLVYWIWGCVYAGDTWLIGTEMLDKFIDSHKEE